MAAPVAGKILSEVLPYLGVPKEGEENKNEVYVPDLIGKTIKEAKEILKEKNLEITVDENIDQNAKIIRQIPEKDINVLEGTSIVVHTN